MRRGLILAVPCTWLLLFLLLPMAIMLAIAFASPTEGIPPFTLGFDPSSFHSLFADTYYLSAFLLSLRIASVATLICLLIGYPMALAIARAPLRWRGTLLMLVVLPFWTGFLTRISAWIGLLKDEGWINGALLALGLIKAPLWLLYTNFAMYLGIAYFYLPFMVLPLYARLSERDVVLEEAAADLGASPWQVFCRIVLPLSLPGVWAGSLLVFIPAIGEYVIPELLGGPGAQTVGRVLWGEFFTSRDWPAASALGIVLLIVLAVPATIWQWRQGQSR